jgi:hypothetical protein
MKAKAEKCKSCKFWSEMIAKIIEGGVWAMCLNPESPHQNNYKHGLASCDAYQEGEPIDKPSNSELWDDNWEEEPAF